MSEMANPSTGPTNPAGSNRSFFQQADWLSFGFTVLVALVIYFGTLAPEVTLEFSGFVSTSADYAGVSYPPGFPVWTIYSWIFVKLLPVYSVAWRVAVGSAVAAALACGLVALMVSSCGPLLLENSPAYARLKSAEQKLLRIVCGFVAGMVLGLSRPVWRMAVVAETWALSVLLFALMLCLLTRWIASPARRRFLYAGLFAFGLLLTSNQELIVLMPALLGYVFLGDKELGRDLSSPVALMAGTGWVLGNLGRFPLLGWLPLVTVATAGGSSAIIAVQTRRFGSEWKPAALCVTFVLLGLACFLYLPVASMTNPPANWAYPRTVIGFLHAITRGQYELPHPTDQLLRFGAQLCTLARQTWAGLGWPCLPLIPLPFCLLPLTVRVASKWLVGLGAALVCAGPLVMAWINPAQDRSSTELIVPYFSAMFVVLAVCVGLGLTIAGSVIAKLAMRPAPTV